VVDREDGSLVSIESATAPSRKLMIERDDRVRARLVEVFETPDSSR